MRAAPVEEAGNAGVLVSPELFDLASRWSSESLTETGPVAASANAGRGDLLSYVRRHAPALAEEAAAVVARAPRAPEGQTGVMQASCSCQIWGTFDKPSASQVEPNWHMHFVGAVHSGYITQEGSGTTREHTADSAVYSTQFRTRLFCTSLYESACAAGCSAKLYSDVLYAAQIHTKAETGGIWNKGSTAQVVEGVTLNFRTPYGGSNTRLFEKLAAVSHYASSSTFNVEELANLAKAGLGIYLALQGTDPSKLSGDLVSQAIKSIAALIHRSGADGTTAQGLIAQFESPFWQPMSVEFSSGDHLYYSFDLASHARMKTRGYGGFHMAEGRVASGASIVAYFDQFVCGAGVSPPGRTGFWRYDAAEAAPVSKASFQNRVGNFLSSGFGRWIDVSAPEGVTQ